MKRCIILIIVLLISLMVIYPDKAFGEKRNKIVYSASEQQHFNFYADVDYTTDYTVLNFLQKDSIAEYNRFYDTFYFQGFVKTLSISSSFGFLYDILDGGIGYQLKPYYMSDGGIYSFDKYERSYGKLSFKSQSSTYYSTKTLEGIENNLSFFLGVSFPTRFGLRYNFINSSNNIEIKELGKKLDFDYNLHALSFLMDIPFFLDCRYFSWNIGINITGYSRATGNIIFFIDDENNNNSIKKYSSAALAYTDIGIYAFDAFDILLSGQIGSSMYHNLFYNIKTNLSFHLDDFSSLTISGIYNGSKFGHGITINTAYVTNF